MAITEDGSQPLPVHVTTTSGTTAAFSPPANSLLVALVALDGPNSQQTTNVVSDSGSHSWTRKARGNTFVSSALSGSAEVWECQLSSAPGSITVSSSWSGANGGDLVVRVLNGAASDQSTAATNTAGGSSIAPTVALTPTQVGSHVYGAVLDFTTNATLTVNGNTSSIDQFVDATNGDTWAVFKGAADTTTLTSTTFGYTNGAAAYNLAAVEILAAATGGSAPQPLVASTPWTPATTRSTITASFPLGNPAVPTPGPRVVSPQPGIVPVPGAKLFAAPNQPGAPGPLLVSPPFTWPYMPPVSVTASQPLGNPAVGTGSPLVISTSWSAKVPGAIISSNPAAPVISTTGTPGPLVVTPPFAPVPVPLAYLSASQPLGNPAVSTPQPLVVSTFTLAPVPGAKVFSSPAAPPVVAVPTPGPLVVTPPWQPVPIPRTVLSWSSPLGNPAVPSPQPLVIGPPQQWPTWTAALISVSPASVTTTPPRAPTLTVDLARAAVTAETGRLLAVSDTSRVAVAADLSRVTVAEDLTRPVVVVAL